MMSEILVSVLKIATSNMIGFDPQLLKNEIVRTESNPSMNEEITADALHAYAKIEQELAIARRTLISETVEIEEYYGNSLKGDVGAKISATDFGLGASGESGKVTKRIIRFSGFNAQTESMLNAIEASLLSKLKSELATGPKKTLSESSNSSID